MIMDVAVVHDRLCNRGGGEKVAITIAEALDADVYVGNYEPEKTFEFKGRVAKTNPMRDTGETEEKNTN